MSWQRHLSVLKCMYAHMRAAATAATAATAAKAAATATTAATAAKTAAKRLFYSKLAKPAVFCGRGCACFAF